MAYAKAVSVTMKMGDYEKTEKNVTAQVLFMTLKLFKDTKNLEFEITTQSDRF